MDNAVDRALARQRAARRLKEAGTDERRLREEHLLDMGSVVLGSIRELSEAGPQEAFRLHAGLDEDEEILIHRCKERVKDEVGHNSFYLTVEGDLIYETTLRGPDGLCSKRVDLDHLEDFLNVDLGSLESLYEEVTRDGFLDRLVFRLANWSKPGYEDVWK